MALNAKPCLLYDNVLDGGTLSATGTDADDAYDVDHLIDGRPYTFWKADAAGTKRIEVELSAPLSADSLGLIGHNLGTASATISVESSANGSDWTTRLSAVSLDSDRALFRTWESASALYWRATIVTASVVPYVGVLLIGARLDFPRYPASGYDPAPRRLNAIQNRAKGGWVTGVSIRNITIDISATFDNITPAWVDDSFMPAWDAHLSLCKPFFWVWERTNHADDVYYVTLPENYTLRLPYTPTRRRISLSMEGVVE